MTANFLLVRECGVFGFIFVLLYISEEVVCIIKKTRAYIIGF